MIATSFGTGPFYPAIRWRDRLWVAKVSFDNEDDATNVANGVVGYLDTKAVDYINGLGYSPQARE